MYSKNRSSETKNGLFYKQGAPHTDSLAAPAYQCSVQYFTFGQYPTVPYIKIQVRPIKQKYMHQQPIHEIFEI